MNAIPAAAGSAFEVSLSPEAQGFQVERDERRGWVALVFGRVARREFERFAPEGPPGPRPLRVIVLDPGHGGDDAGVVAQGAQEKTLALALALELGRTLERRLRTHVLLTRTDDRAMSIDERAERANRAHADLVISLHFDGAPGGAARGVTAYCPPATYAGTGVEASGPGVLELQSWRDVATRHAVRSRQLAESVLSSLELRGLGPARLREVLPYPLLGVNAPGMLLECATLTSDADRSRVTSADGIPRLAAAIASGIEAYGKAE
jgi:N-acetylmuramoyl-L-alanine amidase